MRILVVEDYGPIRGAVVTALRDEGWTVELAGDGTTALDKLRGDQPYDLVILDLMLPGMLFIIYKKRAHELFDSTFFIVLVFI